MLNPSSEMPKPSVRHLSFRADHHKADEEGSRKGHGKKKCQQLMLTVIKNIYGKQYDLLPFVVYCPCSFV